MSWQRGDTEDPIFEGVEAYARRRAVEHRDVYGWSVVEPGPHQPVALLFAAETIDPASIPETINGVRVSIQLMPEPEAYR
jgi:hypothetical protein